MIIIKIHNFILLIFVFFFFSVLFLFLSAGVAYSYKGVVKKNNWDGTFNIKFQDPNSKSNKKYVDQGVTKAGTKTRIELVHIDDIEDGVLIALLQDQVRECLRWVKKKGMLSKYIRSLNRKSNDVTNYFQERRRKSQLGERNDSSRVDVGVNIDSGKQNIDTNYSGSGRKVVPRVHVPARITQSRKEEPKVRVLESI